MTLLISSVGYANIADNRYRRCYQIGVIRTRNTTINNNIQRDIENLTISLFGTYNGSFKWRIVYFVGITLTSNYVTWQEKKIIALRYSSKSRERLKQLNGTNNEIVSFSMYKNTP